MSNEKEFLDLISTLNKKDILDQFVLIGSWVLKVYDENYKLKNIALVTKDIDLLVKNPRGPFKKEISIHKILQEKGYKPKHSLLSGSEKYIPDLSVKGNELDIEFLCQPGRHIKESYQIKELGITVQAVQYQEILLNNSLQLKYKGIKIDVPDPIVWAIHKIAISQARVGTNRKLKMINDISVSRLVIDFFGEDKVLERANQFKGKFLRLFKKGWMKYLELKEKDIF